MALIGNNEEPKTWLHPKFPRLPQIKAACPREKRTGKLSYSQTLDLMKQGLEPQERLVITRKILPSQIQRQGRKTIFNPNGDQVWHHGNRIRIRPFPSEVQWTQELAQKLEFNLHSQSKKSLRNS